MRRGFTLAELLITLGIIAVISALLAASIVKLKPDSDKATFLKQYDAVMNITNKIVNNSRLYPICQNDVAGEEKWDCRQHPLFNIAQTSVDGKSVNGTGKYCDLLAMSLSGKKLSDNSCSLNPTYADGAWTPTFTTKNGSEWLVSTSRSAAGDAESGYSASYQTEVYIDLNGAKGPNCLYDKDNCKKPDRFKLLVAADGTTIVADPMGQAYVNTRKNWNKKPLEIADDAVVVANLNVNLKDFALQRCGAGAGSHEDPPAPNPVEPVEPVQPSDPGCEAGQFKFHHVESDACYPPHILIESKPVVVNSAAQNYYLSDWDFHVWTNTEADEDITVFIGYLDPNKTDWRDVPFEIGCKIPKGQTECSLDVKLSDYYPGSSADYRYAFCIERKLKDILGINYKNYKINPLSNSSDVINTYYGAPQITYWGDAALYVKITSKASQRGVSPYRGWDGIVKNGGAFYSSYQRAKIKWTAGQ